eukprot:UN10532
MNHQWFSILSLVLFTVSTFGISQELQEYLTYERCDYTTIVGQEARCQTGCRRGGCPNGFTEMASTTAYTKMMQGGDNCWLYTNEICSQPKGYYAASPVEGVRMDYDSINDVNDGDNYYNGIFLFVFGCTVGSCITLTIALSIAKCSKAQKKDEYFYSS